MNDALPTIHETPRRRTAPSVPPRRRTNNISPTYALPPSSESDSSSSSSTLSTPRTPHQPTWRRASPFPLGPVPPPVPPRRPRHEPQPHIVDIAVERFKINTHTISTTHVVVSRSAQENERERQWEKWESERIRAQQMTNEAAKNNRVQAPRSNASSSSTSRTTVSEKKPVVTKKAKRSWWCFGGSVESDCEEVVDEKRLPPREERRRSVASLDAVEVDDEEEEDDEEEWHEARTAGNGLLGLSCSKSSNRQRATLKKKTQ